MDDKPAIEYHPFGTITLNFDDGPVKLRRCRYGDLRFAKDLLEEVRVATAEQRDAWVDEVAQEQLGVPGLDASQEERDAYFSGLSAEGRMELNAKVVRINLLNETIREANRDLVHNWLSQIAARMGDAPLPVKDEWPIEILSVQINDIITHWQSVPLASGKSLGQNRTITDQNSSGPHLVVVSSPPEPQPQ